MVFQIFLDTRGFEYSKNALIKFVLLVVDIKLVEEILSVT